MSESTAAGQRPVKIPGPEHPITIEPNPGRVVVSIDGQQLADTREALTLSEAGYAPVQYIPLSDVNARPSDPERPRELLPVQGRGELLQRPVRGRARGERGLGVPRPV